MTVFQPSGEKIYKRSNIRLVVDFRNWVQFPRTSRLSQGKPYTSIADVIRSHTSCRLFFRVVSGFFHFFLQQRPLPEGAATNTGQLPPEVVEAARLDHPEDVAGKPAESLEDNDNDTGSAYGRNTRAHLKLDMFEDRQGLDEETAMEAAGGREERGYGSSLRGMAFVGSGIDENGCGDDDDDDKIDNDNDSVDSGHGKRFSNAARPARPTGETHVDGDAVEVGSASEKGAVVRPRTCETREGTSDDQRQDGAHREASDCVSPPSSPPSETPFDARAGTGRGCIARVGSKGRKREQEVSAAEQARLALQLWWPLLAGLSGGAGDPRLDCRSAALSTLQDVLRVSEPTQKGGLPRA